MSESERTPSTRTRSILPRVGRALRWIAAGAGLLVVVVLAVLVGVVLYLRTDTGLATLGGVIEDLASTPEATLRIGRLGGTFPEDLHIDDVRLSDAQGTMISLDHAALRWHPLRLFARSLDVALLEVGTLTLDRLPASAPTPEEEVPSEPFSLPSLPVNVTVEQVSLGELVLSPEVAGQAARLTADAHLSATREGEFAANLQAKTLSEPPTRVSLDAGYAAATDQLKVHLDLAEAAGGLLGGLIGLPGAPPLRLQAQGDAPLHDWQGRIEGKAGDGVGVDLAVRLSGYEPLNVGVNGTATVSGFLPAEQAPLVAGGVKIEADAAILPERITLDAAKLATAAGTVQAQGTFLPDDERVDATAQIVLGGPTALAAALPGIAYRSVTADVQATGSLPVPDVRLTMRADDLASGDLRAGAVELQAAATPAGDAASSGELPPIDLQANLVARDVAPPAPGLKPLLGQPLRVTLDGRYDAEASQALIRSLQATAGPIELTAKADLTLADTPSGTAELHTNDFALAPLSELAGAPLAGQGRITAQLNAAKDGGFELSLNTAAKDFTSSEASLAALLGRSPTVQAKATGNLNSTIAFDADVRTAQFHATGDGRVAADLSRVDGAKVRVNADDLSGLRPIIGAPIAGRLSLDAEANGPIAQLTAKVRAIGNDIVFQDQQIRRVNLNVDANAVADGTRGTLALDAATSLGNLAATSGFGFEQAAQRLRVDRFRLTFADALTANADLTIPLDGKPIAGRATVQSPNLAPVGKAVGEDLAGRLDMAVVLAEVRGAQQVSADLRLDDVAYGPPAARAAEVGSLRANVQLVDPEVERRLQASVDATNIRAADGVFAKATVQAEGSRGRYSVDARANGDLQGVTQFALQGDVGLAEATAVTLRRLDAKVHGETLALQQPAQIVVGADRLQVDDLTLAFARARATLALLKTRTEVRGRFDLRDFDLALLDKFQPGTGLKGVISADADLSGRPTAPALTANVHAAGVRASGNQKSAVRGQAPSLTAALTATIANGRANATLNAQGLGEQPLFATVAVPARFSVEPFDFTVAETAPIEGQVSWQGTLDPLMQMLPIDAILMTGRAAINLSIAGSMQQPLVNGAISLSGGTLEVFQSGTLLRPLDLEITARGNTWDLTRLEARDGGNGTLSGSGSVVLADPVRVDTRVDLKGFTAVRREDVVSQLDGSVSVNGNVGEQMLVSGRIENRDTEIRLINRLPPSVVTVNVKFTDAPPPPPATPTGEPGMGWLKLDMTISLPGRVFVRGRGLTSEWAGNIDISGTAERPQVRGSLHPVRGDFDVLGKRFTLSEGKITIDGLDQDIDIDLTATYQRSDLTARVIVSGTASQPKLTLESTPELPQDEILARVLFNKSTGRLSAAEAAQLATAAASLASGEPGVLDKLRTATGLDRLTLGSTQDSNGDEVSTVEAGKNISDGVYVGVEQGLTAASSAAVVEVDVTKNIKLRSETTSEGSSRVGLRWEWDY